MLRMMSKTLLLAVTTGLVISSARASTPSAAHSDIPCGIVLVGSTSGVPDREGEFTIVVRDASGTPLAGSLVEIDFNACTPDIRVCSVQPWSGVSADCSGAVGTVTATTDASGTTRMRITGGARNMVPHTPGAGFQCGVVRADGVELGAINVAAFDENGVGGANPADLSLYFSDAQDYMSEAGIYRGRSDFNCSHSLNPADQSLLMSIIFRGRSVNSCSTYCH